jgi:hydroxyacylglutathione hydrolase
VIKGDYKIVTIQTGRWRQNCYLVRHIPSGDLLLIDPGSDDSLIIDNIESEGARLKLILLTHAHHDHVGAVKAVSEAYQLPFYLRQEEVRLLNRAPTYALAFENKVIRISKNYKLLGSENLVWSGAQIGFMHLPGHTPGGMCFHFEGFAFTGDTLLNEFVGRTDLPGANPLILGRSISNMLNALAEDTILFPGHGKPWTVAMATDWWNRQKGASQEYRKESDL